jgi:hypothetical protein
MRLLFVFSLLFAGVAANAAITVSQSFVNFNDVEVGGYSPTAYVSVYNNGQVATYITLNHNCFIDYTVTNFCGNLNPGGVCQISIQFSPRQRGSSSCNIGLIGSQGGGTANIAVRGSTM